MNTPILHLPYPTTADTADVPRDLQALALAIDPLGTIPVGGLLLWPTAIVPSSAWLFCQGQSVDAASYPALALVLGAAAGQIVLPNFVDLFPVGAGTVALGGTAGAREVTLTPAQIAMPAHQHNISIVSEGTDHDINHAHGFDTDAVGDHEHPSNTPGNFGVQLGNPWGQAPGVAVGTAPVLSLPAGAHSHHGTTYTSPTSLNHTHTVNGVTNVQGTNAAPHENRPPCRAINFIIRAL